MKTIGPTRLRRSRLLLLAAVTTASVLVGAIGTGPAYADAAYINHTWDPIRFNGGVPVTGESQLLVYPNGDFGWRGHFHDSGATSYNMEIGCIVKFNSGALFEVSGTGRVHGTFESGSRNWTWSQSGNSAVLAHEIATGQGAWSSCRAGADLAFAAMLAELKSTAGDVGAVVALVGSVF
jgi:hypothetical protein